MVAYCVTGSVICYFRENIHLEMLGIIYFIVYTEKGGSATEFQRIHCLWRGIHYCMITETDTVSFLKKHMLNVGTDTAV